MLDLSKSDLLACTVAHALSQGGYGSKEQCYLVTDGLQLILVRPDAKRLGFGVAQFVGSLQDVQIQVLCVALIEVRKLFLKGVKDDSKCLLVTISGVGPLAAFDARFTFDDHIRCMAAKQRLTKVFIIKTNEMSN